MGASSGKTKNGLQIPIEKNILKVISEQTKNCLCKIKNNKGDNSIGFFCVIPFINNNNLLPILVLNNANFEENTINKIYITLSNNNDNNIINSEIIIETRRKIYLDREINISFIEIKDKDNIDKNLFLFLDEKIFNFEFYELYDKLIYLIYYTENNYSEYTTRKIKFIDQEKKYFEFRCKNQLSSSGYPIFNLNSPI